MVLMLRAPVLGLLVTVLLARLLRVLTLGLVSVPLAMLMLLC